MIDPVDESARLERTRRQFAKIGIAIGAVLVANLAKPTEAQAGCDNGVGNNGMNNGQGNSCTCFLKGTRIRTADGDANVEDLAAGDLLPTLSGHLRPIRRVTRLSYKRSDTSSAWDTDILPVCIVPSALAPSVPASEVFLTRAHALYIDGFLVPAGNLINDTTIFLYNAQELDELEYFHVELESHDIIYAEGMPCETLLQKPYAPILSFNGGRSEIKSRLRSAASPWIDRRQPLDVIRDHLEERGIALAKPSMSETVAL